MNRKDIYRLLIDYGFNINSYSVNFSPSRRYFEEFQISIESTDWVYCDELGRMIDNIGFNCSIMNSEIELFQNRTCGTRYYNFKFTLMTWMKEGITFNKSIRKHKFI